METDEELHCLEDWGRTVATALGLKTELVGSLVQLQHYVEPTELEYWHTLAEWHRQGHSLNSTLVDPSMQDEFAQALRKGHVPYYEAQILTKDDYLKTAFIFRDKDARLVQEIGREFLRERMGQRQVEAPMRGAGG